jgi:hypothetical protein
MSTASSFGPARAALALGILGLVTPVFALSTSSNNNFVLVQSLALVMFPLLGLVAVVGALTRQRAVIAAAGAAYGVAALVQLVQLGRETNWLGGNGSTFALLLALAVGLLITSALSDDKSTTPGVT